MKTYSLEEITDKYIGQSGTIERECFDFELRADVIGFIIKNARVEQNLTQEQLGKLIGVQKAQIFKIENNAKDVRFSTLLRVFEALKAQVNFSVKLPNHENVLIA